MKLTVNTTFRIIAIFIIATFLTLDIAWAYPVNIHKDNLTTECLSPKVAIFADSFSFAYNNFYTLKSKTNIEQSSFLTNKNQIQRKNPIKRLVLKIIPLLLVSSLISGIVIFYFVPVLDIAVLTKVTGILIAINIGYAIITTRTLKKEGILEQGFLKNPWSRALLVNFSIVSLYILYLIELCNFHALQKLGYYPHEIKSQALYTLTELQVSSGLIKNFYSEENLVKSAFEKAKDDYPYKRHLYDINEVFETNRANCLGKAQLVYSELKALGLNVDLVYQYPYHYFVLVHYSNGKSQIIDSSMQWLSPIFIFNKAYKQIDDGYSKYQGNQTKKEFNKDYQYIKILKNENQLKSTKHLAFIFNLLSSGWENKDREKLEEAIKLLKSTISLEGESFETRMTMGRIFWRLGDNNNARIHFKKAEKISPSYFEDAAKEDKINIPALRRLMGKYKKKKKQQASKADAAAKDEPFILPSSIVIFSRKQQNLLTSNTLIFQAI
ncbi:MAG: hypothetical protein ABIG64_03100 [Candidatus Omnitrophota bacterium]